MQAHGYAPWETEYKFALKTHGRKWANDLAWPDLRVSVEIEGRGSHQRGRYLTDMEKYNRAAVMGWMLIRVTYDMIADGSALRLLEEAFALRQSA
jgi:very-short-patch-repair endonuclease